MSNHHDRAAALPAFDTAWSAFLLIASAAGSLAFACVTPFAALATVATMTLPFRLALATMTGAWLFNQAIGFLVLTYPVSGDSLLWGLTLGLSALAALAAAHRVAKRVGDRPAPARWIAGLAAAFLVQQGLLLAASGVLGSGEGFTATVIGGVASLDMLWTLALAAIYGLVSAVRLGMSPFHLRRTQSM